MTGGLCDIFTAYFLCSPPLPCFKIIQLDDIILFYPFLILNNIVKSCHGVVVYLYISSKNLVETAHKS